MSFSSAPPPIGQHWQEPVSFHGESFRNRCRWGRKLMADSKAVFCLLGRDVATGLRGLAGFIEARGDQFLDYRVIFIENDSVDDTPALLNQWALANRRVQVVTETLGLPRWPAVASSERAEQLAKLRNHYLELIPDLDLNPDYIVVIDGDLSRGLNARGFTSSFGYQDWDVMSSNGIANDNDSGQAEFYDAWAFRQDGPEQDRSFAEINALQFRPGMPPIPVWSGFGGMAIYRAECLLDARYGADDCEHVVLHRHMREHGHTRHYMNPSQTVLY